MKQFLTLNQNKKYITIFYATWCPFCINNVPLIAKTIVQNKIENAIFVDISDPKLDVWKEDNNIDWAIEIVPTIRVYFQNQVIYEHTNVIGEAELNKIINNIIC